MKLSGCLFGGMLIPLVLCGTSCSTPNSAASGGASNNGQYYVVAAKEAEFYRYGPQQANGPDERLPQGTLVSLVRASFGYSKVQLMNGVQGYVASQDIHAAPPEVVQAATNPSVEAGSTGSVRGSEGESSHRPRFRYDIVDPRFLPPPEPLPVDIPEPSPDTTPSPTP
jgi:hypothetical protein